MTEAQEQRFLFQWAGYAEQQFPELKLLHHVPNGGKRDARTAASLKKEGVKAGVPDICLPVGRGGYLGLYIELKVGKNKTSLKQKEWIEKLRQQGYRVEVCYGWLEAKEEIEQYMKWENTLKAIDYTKFL